MTFGFAKQRARSGLASTSALFALSCTLLANVGCSSDNNNTGSGGTSYGGNGATTGGRSATGGVASTTGGAKPTGGASTVGGGLATGGNSATGGASAMGGASATGGVSPTGGAGGAMGGSTAGGVTSVGGATLGGASSTGGSKATGGTGNGGVSATGGTSTIGGGSAVGGTAATGGSKATGGSGGVSTTGGTTTAGGATATGGTSTAGGASTIGGSSATGGTGTVGGTSAVGGTGAGGETSSVGLRNLALNMTGMTTNVNQLMEFRLVTTSTNLLKFVGILDVLPGATYNFAMPNSAINEPYQLDFFADVNGNRSYDAPPTDNAWRVPVPAGIADAQLTFARSTNFTDISTPAFTPLGADFTFQATGMVPHVGQLFELRVIAVSTGQVVGRYVLTSVPAANFSITIPMIAQDLANYQIDFFADLNQNGKYDPPPTDHAWRLMAVGTPTGLTVAFAHNTTFTDVGF